MFKSFACRGLMLLLTCVVIIGAGQVLLAGDDVVEDERESRVRPAEAGAIKVGDISPDFELPRLTIEKDKDGKAVGRVSEEKVRLSSFRGKKPVFLVFSSYT